MLKFSIYYGMHVHLLHAFPLKSNSKISLSWIQHNFKIHKLTPTTSRGIKTKVIKNDIFANRTEKRDWWTQCPDLSWEGLSWTPLGHSSTFDIEGHSGKSILSDMSRDQVSFWVMSWVQRVGSGPANMNGAGCIGKPPDRLF